jgi:hypothetical protein
MPTRDIIERTITIWIIEDRDVGTARSAPLPTLARSPRGKGGERARTFFSPPPCGEGSGVGVGVWNFRVSSQLPPPRRATRVDPPHKGEGKKLNGEEGKKLRRGEGKKLKRQIVVLARRALDLLAA